MILSDIDIRGALASGDIQIEPFNESRLKAGSYTFTLGTRLFRVLGPAEIDTRNPKLDLEEIQLGEEGHVLEPGAFLLGQTAEELTLTDHLCCFLDARTTLARVGLNVLQSSTFIQPGQRASRETLEITNVGSRPVRLFPGVPIVKGVFEFVRSAPTEGYGASGKYAAQSSPNLPPQ